MTTDALRDLVPPRGTSSHLVCLLELFRFDGVRQVIGVPCLAPGDSVRVDTTLWLPVRDAIEVERSAWGSVVWVEIQLHLTDTTTAYLYDQWEPEWKDEPNCDGWMKHEGM